MPDEPSWGHMDEWSQREKIATVATLTMPERGCKHGAERASEATQRGSASGRGDAKRAGGASL